MPVDDVGALAGTQRRPVPAVRERARPRVELGDQFGDRAGPAELGIEPGVVDLQEDPLGPLVVVDVGGGEATPRVVAQPESSELAPEVDDVGLGAGARVGSGLDGVLLGGQPERIETQRVQHITAGHPEVAGVDVGRDVAERVPDMQTLTGRIGEHVLDEHLVDGQCRAVGGGQRADRVGHVERSAGLPLLLPAALDVPGELGGVAVAGGVGVGGRLRGRRFGHLTRV